jgi:hypothetical protein
LALVYTGTLPTYNLLPAIALIACLFFKILLLYTRGSDLAPKDYAETAFQAGYGFEAAEADIRNAAE